MYNKEQLKKTNKIFRPQRRKKQKNLVLSKEEIKKKEKKIS
jgi:hypothetical protein